MDDDQTPERFDLVVIGSGPAGEKGAVQAAYFGKRVALIEKEPAPGGAAANTGTLPSKTLRETALFLSGFRHRRLDGLDLHMTRRNVGVRDFMARERIVVDHERGRIYGNLEKHNVTYLKGTASFVDPHTVRVRPVGDPEFQVSGDVILIATGSSPHQPKGYAFEDPRIYDSDEILALERIPASMLVVGGGVIGCEYASMFAALGIKVTLLEKRDRLLSFLDAEMSETLRADMVDQGVQMIFGDEVAEVDDAPDPIRVRLASGRSMEVEAILVSSGRSGNTKSLGLDAIGLAPDGRGNLKVNEDYQTEIPHIYACGDVIGFPALASTAMEQARIAVVHAFDLKYKKNLATVLPYGIYTIPECSMAGATESELQEKGIPYVVGKAMYNQNARGQIIGDYRGFLKLLAAEDDGKLLGVHVIGEQATDLVHLGLTALLTGAGVDLFIQSCYNYPTLTELYKYAAYDALGHIVRRRAAVGPTS